MIVFGEGVAWASRMRFWPLFGELPGAQSHPHTTPPSSSPCPPDDYKEFGVNCERMASEIEERILWGLGGPGGGQGQGQRVVGTRPWGVPARSLQREPGAH